MTSQRQARYRVLAAAIAALFAMAGCSSSGATTTSQSTSANSAGAAEARAAIAAYVGHPSPFPAGSPLTQRPPAGTEFVYLQCSSPICALVGQVLVAPTSALGIKLTVINSGATATSAQAAAAAALAEKPAVVLLPAVDPQIFGDSLHQLVSAGVKVVGGGIINGAPYGVQQVIDGASVLAEDGKLLADWVAANKGPNANLAYFGTPELSYSPVMLEAFKTELSSVCPTCKADYQQLSITTIGKTAPNRVISYLQAHPLANTVVFANMEASTGFAAALEVADLKITTLGFSPSPGNLQDIQSGGLTVGLGDDFAVQGWMYVNVAARMMANQSIVASELVPDRQFLQTSDINQTDISRGWSGYPDVAQRFSALWNLGK